MSLGPDEFRAHLELSAATAGMRLTDHCLALDQRGHGDSEWSPQMDYAIESHVGDIDAFLQTLELRRVVLVGMSLGGVNALAWAGQHSRRLAARSRPSPQTPRRSIPWSSSSTAP